jgi:transcriptional regulator with XRE-family HTH domain
LAIITEEQALNRLRAKIGYSKKIKDLAADFGVSPPFMSAVLAGDKRMTDRMLKSIAVRRRVTFETDE